MSEWSLVIFTVAIQLSFGLALTTTWFDGKVRPSHGAVMRPVGVAIFPLAALGLMASLLHLGHPLSAWKSFLNLGSSRLSLEVLLTGLFALAAAVHSYSWWKEKSKHRFLMGVTVSTLGLAAVVSSATIYLVPTQPAWNSGWVPLSFLGTALLLGGFASVTLVDLKGPSGLVRAFLTTGIVGSVALFISAVWMLTSLSQVPNDDFASARLHSALQFLLTSPNPFWFGAYLLLTGILPTGFTFWLWPGSNDSAEFSRTSFLPRVVFIAVAFGAIIGRTLMYLLVTALPPL
jgi:anaerobic dimethyl sulfoxide reductase subunit C (anchor subunit)